MICDGILIPGATNCAKSSKVRAVFMLWILP
jgi:hypothetical protein